MCRPPDIAISLVHIKMIHRLKLVLVLVLAAVMRETAMPW